ncbi:hypothetical protein B0H13DRAFT_1918738 [Mycena leptocephala]|nr:hypothetical protein B0H13DRAFT_1918738 [Mycena leptocephala]
MPTRLIPHFTLNFYSMPPRHIRGHSTIFCFTRTPHIPDNRPIFLSTSRELIPSSPDLASQALQLAPMSHFLGRSRIAAIVDGFVEVAREGKEGRKACIWVWGSLLYLGSNQTPPPSFSRSSSERVGGSVHLMTGDSDRAMSVLVRIVPTLPRPPPAARLPNGTSGTPQVTEYPCPHRCAPPSTPSPSRLLAQRGGDYSVPPHAADVVGPSIEDAGGTLHIRRGDADKDPPYTPLAVEPLPPKTRGRDPAYQAGDAEQATRLPNKVNAPLPIIVTHVQAAAFHREEKGHQAAPSVAGTAVTETRVQDPAHRDRSPAPSPVGVRLVVVSTLLLSAASSDERHIRRSSLRTHVAPGSTASETRLHARGRERERCLYTVMVLTACRTLCIAHVNARHEDARKARQAKKEEEETNKKKMPVWCSCKNLDCGRPVFVLPRCPVHGYPRSTVSSGLVEVDKATRAAKHDLDLESRYMEHEHGGVQDRAGIRGQ